MKYEKRIIRLIRPILLTGLFTLSAAAGYAGDAVKGAELIQERPTLNSVGFEWRIEGDDNGNALCKVQVKEKGAQAWREVLPLYRIGLGLEVPFAMICGKPRYIIPDALAGSIMELEPGTAYEVRLTLTDPDGVEGEAVRELSVKTRPVPEPGSGDVRHVYPPDYKGKKEKPFYKGLMHAVNGFSPLADCYQTIHPNGAKPGTVIKMHGGVYKNVPFEYHFRGGQPEQSWIHGAITFYPKGEPDNPISIVAAGDGEVIIDGADCHTLFNMRSADYYLFDGLTIRGCEIAFHCGFQGLRGGGAKGLTVRNCWMEGLTYGVLAHDGASEDFTIIDNVFLGRNPHDKQGRFGSTRAGYAAVVAGQGHTIRNNYARNFWDGINVFTSSISDPQYGQQSRAIDIMYNDIINCCDQFIEADGGYANIRVLRNRLANCPSQPVSTQPVHAGPVYWIGNIIWNASGGKMNMKNNDGAQVYVFLHNTSSTHMKMPPNAGKPSEKCAWIIQNNLVVGPDHQKTIVEYVDYAADARHLISHNAFNGNVSDPVYMLSLRGSKPRTFASLEELQEQTGHEKNSLLVNGFDIFANAAEPPHNKGGVMVPAHAADVTLKPDAPPVDAGVRLPGINDDFKGNAPDIGAFETGAPLPVFGPRGGPYRERLQDLREKRYAPEPVR